MRAGYTKSCLNQKTFTWFLVNQQVMVFLWDLRAYFYRDIMVNHLIGVCLKMWYSMVYRPRLWPCNGKHDDIYIYIYIYTMGFGCAISDQPICVENGACFFLRWVGWYYFQPKPGPIYSLFYHQPTSIYTFIYIHEPFYWSKPIGWLFKFQSASYFSIQTLPIPKGCFNFGYFWMNT